MNYTLGIPAAALLLAAAVDPAMAPWAQLGAVGLIGALLWWHLVKLAPRERRESRSHTEKVVAEVCLRFDAVQERQRKENAELHKAIRELITETRGGE